MAKLGRKILLIGKIISKLHLPEPEELELMASLSLYPCFLVVIMLLLCLLLGLFQCWPEVGHAMIVVIVHLLPVFLTDSHRVFPWQGFGRDLCNALMS